MRYRAVNACVLFMAALDGKQLLTVEDLAAADGGPHPVQTALAEHHGSQCGFCTPGFAMSLFALDRSGAAVDRAEAVEALAGNLCRCTGYRPILDAALAARPPDPEDTATAARLRALTAGGPLRMKYAEQAWHAPETLTDLAAALVADTSAVPVAGGTDAGVWVSKQHRRLNAIVSMEKVQELRAIERRDGMLRIGAAVPYEDALGELDALFPDLGAMVRRIGSRQIRERGTIGANIANASPIGDVPPALIALDAKLVLRRGAAQRTVPIETFFAGYRRTILTTGEFIESVDIPLPKDGRVFRCHKVAKRFDQDISAVCAAFSAAFAGGAVRDIRIGFGGMAATPARAHPVENILIGQPWTEASVRAAMTVLDATFVPISDHRARAAYRRLVARNLLYKFFLETAASTPRTRLVPAP